MGTLDDWGCSEIIGDGFSLRQFEISFISDQYLSWLRDKEVNRHLIGANSETSIESVKKYCLNLIESPDNLFLGIFTRERSCHIGNVRLGPFHTSEKKSGFGIMIGDSRYRGIGLGTKIIASSVAFCFGSMGMEQFILEVPVEHAAAQRAYINNGFRPTGIRRKVCRADGISMELEEMILSKNGGIP